MKKRHAFWFATLFVGLLQSGHADTNTVNLSGVPATAAFGTTITLTSEAISDPQPLFRQFIYYNSPSSTSSQIIWDTYADYIFSNDRVTTTSITLNQAGVWQFAANAAYYPDPFDPAVTAQLDSGYYSVTVSPPPAPAITSALEVWYSQLQSISYQITASHSPTSFGASSLPTGLSVNTSTGFITGSVAASGTYSSSISASSVYGTDTKTLVWHIAAASIVPAGSVSPSTISNTQSVTLVRNGTANFGIGHTENTIWPPVGAAIPLANAALGSSTYTPVSGPGTYQYQFRIVDIYGNYQDQWIGFTVIPLVTAPTTLSSSSLASTSVTIGWSGASADVGIDHYKVFRNGTFLADASSASYADSGLTPTTSYTYQVETVDTQGDVSPLSPSLTATTLLELQVFTPLP